MRVRYDAVVVLGASGRRGEASPALARRVRHGIEIFHEQRARFLILSGGAPRGRPTEAERMHTFVRAAGIADDAVLLEDRSHRTLENATFTAQLMKANGLSAALVVTDPFHMPRALYTFRRAGVAVTGSAAHRFWREVGWWRWPVLGARELAAFAVYAWRLRSGCPPAGMPEA